MTNLAKIVSRSTIVAAPAQMIFDLLADPRRHGEIDGSGSIQSAQLDAPERLSLNATFGMKMKIGVPYKITNTVVEFEEGKTIAWRHFGGHIWRYNLEPTDGGTKVTEQFDWNRSKTPLLLKLRKSPQENAKFMEKTLENLVKKFA
ncbi:MAG: dimethyladenosine transferase [Ilumatobacteraceae bacterium]|nr:dimethyladenosine transferase [Ilumatobacteraceae bacterium]